MDLDPAKLSDAIRAKLLTGLVVPRPIAVVSTISTGGQLNVAPFSYFNVVSDTPMALAFSMTAPKPDGLPKDTLRNVRPASEGGLGEFVVNILGEEHAAAIAAAGVSLPYGESEFDYAGLAPAASVVIRPPRVAEAAASFECKTLHIIEIGEAHLVIGSVVHVWLRDDLVDDRMRVDPDRLRAVGRLAGTGYCRTSDRFQYVTGARPTAAASAN